MSPRRPRLMTIGFNIYGTGLTRVMRTLCAEWAERFEIDYLGIGRSDPMEEIGGVRMWPTNTRGGGDAFAAFQALDMARDTPPDTVLILHDIWMFEYYTRVLAPLRPRSKLVGYIPLDGDIADPAIAAPLTGLDRVVVYTDWAAQEITRAFDALARDGHPGPFPPVDIAFHGVDTAAFAPDPALVAAGFDPRARAAVKREVFGDLPGIEDSFVVLNAARPCVRKRVDLTIAGFARFAQGKPDTVKLCLHHAIAEDETQDLLSLIDTHGIRDRVVLNPLNTHGKPLSEGDLARLYRACDVGLNTAMGEGWGLVSFEHAATGAAQVLPDHTACGALWSPQTAQMIRPEAAVIPGFSPLRMGEVTAAGTADALQALWADRARLARLGAAGCDYVHGAAFRWPTIAARFAPLLNPETVPA